MTEPAFYQPLDAGKRPWGSETVLALVPGIATMKCLRIKKGHSGRLQRHHCKDEAGYVMSGVLVVEWVSSEGLRSGELHKGDSFHFPVGCIHRETAKEDCVVLEVSSPFKNDREGMEEMFDLPVPEDALPSTRPEEVTMWEPWWKQK